MNKFLLSSLLFACNYISLSFGESNSNTTKYVHTPIGDRPSQCVHYAPQGHEVQIKDGYTILYDPKTNKKEIYKALDECVEDAKQLTQRRRQRQAKRRKGRKGKKQLSNLKDWEDFAYSDVPTMGTFTATYTLPTDSPPETDGELLYYFIGLQNDDDATITIIQPVIAYCADCGDDYGIPNGWSMIPWNCCANGQTWYGKDATLEEGAEVQAVIIANDTEVYIASSSADTLVSLDVKDLRRTFDWAAVTLEQYNARCDLYPTTPFVVTDIYLEDEKGTVVTPRWETSDGECEGGAVVRSETEIAIYGKDAPSN